ncbi:MepB family protein [Erysipelothrix urinaevulpis]
MLDFSDEIHNKDYEGFTFEDPKSKHTVRSRLAKKTATKPGYFVSFWEKDSHNKNQAYAYEDSPDIIAINILDDQHQGVFLFPKDVLLHHKILRSHESKGKMGIRVYPPSCKNLNKTAQHTQAWQQNYYKEKR